MYWLEIGSGLYIIFVIVLGIFLHDKRDIDFGLTYMWGASAGCVVWAIIETISRKGVVDIYSASIALFVTGFAVFMTSKK